MKAQAVRRLAHACLCCLTLTVPVLAAEPPSAVPELTGSAWREQGSANLLRFEEERVVERFEGQLVMSSVLRRAPNRLVLRRGGRTEVWKISASDGALSIESLGKARSFERLAELPPELTVEPFKLGEMLPLPPERVQQIAGEIKRRFDLDQEPRKALITDPKSEALKDRMRAVDEDNRRYLRELLAEVGWIDGERFGKEPMGLATVMVKHHADLPVQTAVLPFLEKSGSYGLFYDGLQIVLGKPQRFGTQVGEDFTGKPCVLALEDPEKVDAFRKEIGQKPLADYLAQASEVLFQGRPVQLQCTQPPLE